MQTNYYAFHNSPIGYLTIGVSSKGLARLSFGKQLLNNSKNVRWVQSEEHIRPYAAQLDRYFRGEARSFSFPLDLEGTPFQKKCWNALLDIPYGKTKSYGQVARQVGCPKASRAVGGANHRNPVAIVVPCHRVIASDGSMGGYGGGLKTKEYLLRLEGALS